MKLLDARSHTAFKQGHVSNLRWVDHDEVGDVVRRENNTRPA